MISDKLIIDPNYMAYQQIKDTLIWNILDRFYPTIDKMDIVKAYSNHGESLYEMLKELKVIDE